MSEHTSITKKLLSLIKSADLDELRNILNTNDTSMIFDIELPIEGVNYTNAGSNLIALITENAFLNWEKYKAILIMLVEDYKISKSPYLEISLFKAFKRSITYDGHFVPEFSAKCCEYLITKVGITINLTEEYLPTIIPKEDPDSLYILFLIAISSSTIDIPNALWFYQVLLMILNKYPSFSMTWYSIFFQSANPLKKKWISHPVITQRLDKLQKKFNENSPRISFEKDFNSRTSFDASQKISFKKDLDSIGGLVVGSWDLSGIELKSKKSLSSIANAIISDSIDILAVQEIYDNRIILDIIRRLGPDWSFLLSPQLKPQDGRNYVESYAFIFRSILNIEEYGYISSDNFTQSRPMFHATFRLNGFDCSQFSNSLSLINLHALPKITRSMITKLSKILRVLPESRLESILLVGDFGIQAFEEDWGLIKDLGFTPTFQSATGIKNLTSVLTSTTQQTTKIYDNIWCHQSLLKTYKTLNNINTDISWNSGHHLVSSTILFPIVQYNNPYDSKSLNNLWEDWDFKEEPFWEDNDMFDSSMFSGQSGPEDILI